MGPKTHKSLSQAVVQDVQKINQDLRDIVIGTTATEILHAIYMRKKYRFINTAQDNN